MFYLRAARGVTRVLRNSPFTVAAIDGAVGVFWVAGVDLAAPATDDGTFLRGLSRVNGYIYTTNINDLATVLDVSAPSDLLVRYDRKGTNYLLTFSRVVFGGVSVGARFAQTNLSDGTFFRGIRSERELDTVVGGIPFKLDLTAGIAANVVETTE